MNGTPAPHRAAPRLSGIPTPGRGSGIPTPGRPRYSVSAATQEEPAVPEEQELLQRALSDAIKANDPARFRAGQSVGSGPPTSPDRSDAGHRQARQSRTPYVPRASLRPPSAASAASSSSASRLQIPNNDSPSTYTTAPSTPINRSGPASRAKTPLTAAARPSGSFTPYRRPDSRQSLGGLQSARSISRAGQAFDRSSSRLGRAFEVGDKVRIESLGVEGSLRYLGEVHFKPGTWAGVELSGGFAGRGKNDGTVDGTRYFDCPPKCGVFVAAAKLSSPAATFTRPQSSASAHSAFSKSGRVTPGMFASSGSNDFETPTASRVRPSLEAAVVSAGRITAGSRASRYVGMTAQQLSSRPAEPGAASPTRAPTVTPRAAGRQSIGAPGPGPSAYRSRLSVAGVTPKPMRSLREDPASLSPSLSMPALSVTSTSGDTGTQDEDSPMLESSTRAFQDRVQKLMSEDLTMSARSSPVTSPSGLNENVFPHSPISTRSEGRLLEQIETLQRENERLVDELHSKEGTTDSGTIAGELQSKLRDAERLLQVERERGEVLESEVKEQVSLRESEKEQAAAILQAADERVEEAEKREKSFTDELARKANKFTQMQDQLHAKTSELHELARKLEEQKEERGELLSQVDELRKAGQETIALYEERLASDEGVRYELEEQIQALEEQLRLAAMHPALPIASSGSAPAESVEMIDNETLREQVAHYQSRVTKLEDQLEDAQVERLKQEETDRGKLTKARDQEAAVRKELDSVRKEVDRISIAEQAARGKIEELEIALRENDEALENARAEVEGLRTELSNRAALPESSSDKKLSKVVPEHSEEVARLNELLETIRLGRDAAVAECDTLRREIGLSNHTIAELRSKLEAVDRDRIEVDRIALELPSSDRRRESYSSSSSKLSRVSSTEKDKESRDQIKGLKHMVQELQKENSTLVSQMKMLEADNKALRAESDDLKEALSSLEETVEARIAEEEQALERDTQGPPVVSHTSNTAQQSAAEVRSRQEIEVQQLKQLAKKHERTIHDLNKEVAELESLVESKIYREDDLERELERYKEKLARLQRSSKPTEKSSSARTSHHSATVALSQSPAAVEDVCEICGGNGHDIASCPVFSTSPAALKRMNGDNPQAPSDNKPTDQPWCDDCEMFGHRTVECPHSQDVF